MYSSPIPGESIRSLRIQRGMTQKELAEKVGITQQSVNLIEHGKRKIDIGLYIKISEILDPEHTELIHFPNDKEYTRLPDMFSNDTLDGVMLNTFHMLNEKGQKKAIEQVDLLTKISEYRRDTE